jgi:hypothetical protein
MLNHREAIRCCTLFPLDRLLTETDAPFQPLRGKQFSSYADLRLIITAMAGLRGEAALSLESIIEDNFRRAFNIHIDKNGEICNHYPGRGFPTPGGSPNRHIFRHVKWTFPT